MRNEFLAITILPLTAFLAAAGSWVGCKSSGPAAGDAQAPTDVLSSAGGSAGSSNGGATGSGGITGNAGAKGSGGATGSGGAPGDGGITGNGAAGGGGTIGDGGTTGSGGATGNPCLDSTGAVSPTMKACTTASDCKQATIPTCCGSDLVVGVANAASCAFPVPNCSGLGCAKSSSPRAEDGNTVGQRGILVVDCSAGLCTSRVNGQGGSGGAAGDTGGAGGTAGHDGSIVDSGTGACNSDGDCVFRSSAGCCGACLAVGDPVPAPIPCGARCATFSTCACVNGHCAVGTLPLNASCETAHDLCQVDTKCCVTCGPRPPDGSSGCQPPTCTAVQSSSTPCPLTL
jgi:hypothetical protein